MKTAHGLFLLCLLTARLCTWADTAEQLAKVERLESGGEFQAAAALLRTLLSDQGLAPTNRQTAEFELDRLDRIRKDFPHTKEALHAALKKSVRGLKQDEFEAWVAEGRFDSRVIDGQRRFMVSSVSNLFFRYPELNDRRLPPRDTAKLERAHLETCAAIQSAVQKEGKPYVLPKKFRATMTVTAAPGAAPAQQTIRAWLPVPRDYPFQSGFMLVSSSPAVKQIEPGTSPIRSVYLEQPARESAPTEFRIDYEYLAHGVRFNVDASRVVAAGTNEPNLAEFTRESPHVVFSPEMRALAKRIAGAETNPYLKARAFYDWIAANIKYSYAIEYSTIRNISEYCRERGYGDCGQEALLFITLCRLSGIPARWQSGWSTFPGAKTIHDWSEIYLAPYGWIPVDPYMGIYATRYANTLNPEEKRQLRDFYFGGLDQYRMIANSDHSQKLNPPNRSHRSDTVDFQRGELEQGGKNIYFDQFSYDLEVREIALP